MKFLWFNLQVRVQGSAAGATCQRMCRAVKYAGTFSTNPLFERAGVGEGWDLLWSSRRGSTFTRWKTHKDDLEVCLNSEDVANNGFGCSHLCHQWCILTSQSRFQLPASKCHLERLSFHLMPLFCFFLSKLYRKRSRIDMSSCSNLSLYLTCM